MDKTGWSASTVGFQLQKFLFKIGISSHKKSWKPQQYSAKLLYDHGVTLHYGILKKGIVLMRNVAQIEF